MRKILFIINTILDREKEVGIADIAQMEIDREKFDAEFIYSEYSGHSTEIARDNIDQYDIIVAVGGDGTVNEVAQPLINTGKIMGVVPVGSGNGLARSLNIPLKVYKAVHLINEGYVKTIDTGTLNEMPFIHMAGLGFAAEVARRYATTGNHGMAQYVNQVIRAFLNYKSSAYNIRINGNKYHGSFFLVDFANASQWGYNAHIAPGADPSDGNLNICMLSVFPKIIIPVLVLRLFLENIHRSRFIQIIPFKEAEISNPDHTWTHIDGDPVPMEGNIHVRILPASLHVISGIE
jgi:diacylglycerol kinase (ATP)